MLDTIVTYPCAEGVKALVLCTGWCSRGRGAYLNIIEHVVHGILIGHYRLIQRLLALVRAACSDGGCQMVHERAVQLGHVLGIVLLQEPVILAFYAFVGGLHRAVGPLSRAVLLSPA